MNSKTESSKTTESEIISTLIVTDSLSGFSYSFCVNNSLLISWTEKVQILLWYRFKSLSNRVTGKLGINSAPTYYKKLENHYSKMCFIYLFNIEKCISVTLKI